MAVHGGYHHFTEKLLQNDLEWFSGGRVPDFFLKLDEEENGRIYMSNFQLVNFLGQKKS